MKNKIKYFATILFIISAILPVASFAQAGSLDLSFDTDGIVSTPIGGDDDYANAIAIQPDGKIVAAGYSYNGVQDVFALARYNTNGSLDNTFDADGIVTTTIGTSGNRAHAVALQSDGKILVAGYSYSSATGNDFTLARYNANGSLDNSFDADGIVITPLGGFTNDRAFSVAVQSDGKIVAAGYQTDIVSTQRDFALIRYLANGNLDNTFNVDGIVSLSIAPGNDEGRSVIVQDDGRIIVAGYSYDFTTREFAMVRFNTDGSLDNSFDTDGIVTSSIGSGSTDDAAYSAALQDDGKIVVAGYTNGTSYDYAVVRYNINGSLDFSFGTDGIVVTSIGTSGTSSDEAHAITLQTDGKIVVAGHADEDFSMARYDADGSLDNSFDTDGTLYTDVSSPSFNDKIEGVSLQSDGKIVAVGYSGNGSDYDFTVARYNNTEATGISLDADQSSNISIYPNPFSSSAILHINDALKNTQITIYNVFGQAVKHFANLSGQTIVLNRDNLPSGLYSLLVTQDNEILSRNKFFIAD